MQAGNVGSFERNRIGLVLPYFGRTQAAAAYNILLFGARLETDVTRNKS